MSPAETRLYYLNSRYYDLVVGRFLNAEPNFEKALFDVRAGLIGYNLYAYCANNPIMYKDDTGEGLLLALAIGFAVGSIISGVFKVIQNRKKRKNWYDGLAISMLAGGVGGAISCISIKGVSQFVVASVFGGIGNTTTEVILGEIKTIGDLVYAFSAGAISGIMGYKTAKMLTKGVTKYFSKLTKAGQKKFLSNIGKITNRQLNQIRKAIKNNLPVDEIDKLVKKYGWDVLSSAFVSSTLTTIAS